MLTEENLRAWLRFLFFGIDEAPTLTPAAADAWLEWLSFHQLTPYAWERLKTTGQLATLPAAAADSLRQIVLPQVVIAAARGSALKQVLNACQEAGVETTLLKGAALTLGNAYANPAWRIMGDFDLWVQPEQMSAAIQVMEATGYRIVHKPHRPNALRMAEQQEVEMAQPGVLGQAVDLHYHPFQGEWLSVAMPSDENEGLWQRRTPLAAADARAYRLSAEDNLIHLAVHIAVNHQMGAPGLRAFWDIATSLRAWPVDWDVVLERARRWRVQTALYLVLHLASKWVAAPAPAAALDALRPSRPHRAVLQRILPPEAILRGSELSSTHRRYLYLLALLDQPRDGGRLARRVLLPDKKWLRLRYQDDAHHRSSARRYLHHLWQVLRSPRF